MSATGRSDVRHPDDFYATPDWCTKAIAKYIGLSGVIIDPCCGDGAILRALSDLGASDLHGIEKDAGRAETAGMHAVVRVADALSKDRWLHVGINYVVTNPPFGLSMEFVQRALREVHESGTVWMLLRLNWLASQKRSAWLREHTPSVYVLPKRPSFTGKGTDATDYAWMVWGQHGRPEVTILDV